MNFKLNQDTYENSQITELSALAFRKSILAMHCDERVGITIESICASLTLSKTALIMDTELNDAHALNAVERALTELDMAYITQLVTINEFTYSHLTLDQLED